MWGRNAEEAIQNQKPPVNRITLNDLAASNADWGKLDAGLYGEAARLPQYTAKDYQREAIDAASRYYEKHERGKLIMACGTGKTFTSLRIAERITGERGLVLFLVPSLALVNQTLREWYSQAIKPFTGICVCSDPTVSKQEE